jgi:hypothetical protein
LIVSGRTGACTLYLGFSLPGSQVHTYTYGLRHFLTSLRAARQIPENQTALSSLHIHCNSLFDNRLTTLFIFATATASKHKALKFILSPDSNFNLSYCQFELFFSGKWNCVYWNVKFLDSSTKFSSKHGELKLCHVIGTQTIWSRNTKHCRVTRTVHRLIKLLYLMLLFTLCTAYCKHFIWSTEVFLSMSESFTQPFLKNRASQFQPTGGPHNSLRTRLRAALECHTYIENTENWINGKIVIYKQ